MISGRMDFEPSEGKLLAYPQNREIVILDCESWSQQMTFTHSTVSTTIYSINQSACLRPLLDIGLPKSAPPHTILRLPHPPISRYLPPAGRRLTTRRISVSPVLFRIVAFGTRSIHGLQYWITANNKIM